MDDGSAVQLNNSSDNPKSEAAPCAEVPTQSLWQKAWDCYQSGNYAESLPLLHQGAAQGNFDCLETLAYMYDNGQGVQTDHLEAASWYRKAAELGDVKAMTELASRYQNGFFEIQVDQAEAVLWLRAAAEKGDGESMFRLGQFYENGTMGLPRDLNEAVRWYRAASHSDAKFVPDWAQDALKRLGM